MRSLACVVIKRTVGCWRFVQVDNLVHSINIQVINFYMQLLYHRSQKIHSSSSSSKMPRVAVMNTFFYAKLTSRTGYAGVRRWTRSIRLFDQDLVLFPIHDRGIHWCLAVSRLYCMHLSFSFMSFSCRRERLYFPTKLQICSKIFIPFWGCWLSEEFTDVLRFNGRAEWSVPGCTLVSYFFKIPSITSSIQTTKITLQLHHKPTVVTHLACFVNTLRFLWSCFESSSTQNVLSSEIWNLGQSTGFEPIKVTLA